MSKVSFIIPSRFEQSEVSPGVTVLQRTVQDILEKCTGDIEVIVGFDGQPFQELPNDSRVSTIKRDTPGGIKSMINELATKASGKYIFKSDGHCMFSQGIDEVLQMNMEDNWVVMPRFYVLNEKTWKWQDDRFYDYFYLSCPFTDPRGFRFKAGGHWPELTKERLESHPHVDETPQFHGSGWFVSKEYFLNDIGGFPEVDPLGHAQEPANIGLKAWLGGGKVMVNKDCNYAHMHKGKQHDRGYRFTNDQNEYSYHIAADYWVNNKWEQRKHDFEWFIDKFMPMPTWPEDWRKYL
jgi:hypothetical protein